MAAKKKNDYDDDSPRSSAQLEGTSKATELFMVKDCLRSQIDGSEEGEVTALSTNCECTFRPLIILWATYSFLSPKGLLCELPLTFGYSMKPL